MQWEMLRRFILNYESVKLVGHGGPIFPPSSDHSTFREELLTVKIRHYALKRVAITWGSVIKVSLSAKLINICTIDICNEYVAFSNSNQVIAEFVCHVSVCTYFALCGLIGHKFYEIARD